MVVGAGAVGLAIARKLAERDGTSTLLIERHGSVGTETSSRNSEVRPRYLLPRLVCLTRQFRSYMRASTMVLLR